MELRKGALKFALYVLAVLVGFVGVENLNHLQTLKTEPLRFEAAAAEQVAPADSSDLPAFAEAPAGEPSVAIRSVELTALAGGKQHLSITGTTKPSSLIEVGIISKSEHFRALPDTEGTVVVQADVELRPGSYQVVARAITPDGIEAGPASNPVEFTVPATPANTNRETLTAGGLVVLGVIVSLAALVL